jgi:hypothetical protein
VSWYSIAPDPRLRYLRDISPLLQERRMHLIFYIEIFYNYNHISHCTHIYYIILTSVVDPDSVLLTNKPGSLPFKKA